MASMGSFEVDASTEPGILRIRCEGSLEVSQVEEFVRLHNQAIERFGEAPYRVFLDLRKSNLMSPRAAEVMEGAKMFSAARPNFQGSAVLVSSSVVAMQNRRTSTTSGVTATELISDDEQACKEHLRKVTRPRPR
jgi:hypothetical protein